ncbi:cytidine deaminase [Spirochaeta cellobiosiphila]|uniref:cytidine deaminase n=1 Tax=Spirochaeta cellobiosiphila TaxID=504483 RepID=UPI0004056B72|nr:cytidine deaminase [Spirochaeta cellobiosiphila]
MTDKDLWIKADEIANNSYSPYSRFRVGAVLVTTKGIYVGTNVENRSFGLTICAERTAITQAITQGDLNWKALYLTCIDAEEPVPPCGACRQVISEFTKHDFPVFYKDGNNNIVETTIAELYPQDSLHNLHKHF